MRIRGYGWQVLLPPCHLPLSHPTTKDDKTWFPDFNKMQAQVSQCTRATSAMGIASFVLIVSLVADNDFLHHDEAFKKTFSKRANHS